MHIVINQKEYVFQKCIRDDHKIKVSFNYLAKQSFGFDFKPGFNWGIANYRNQGLSRFLVEQALKDWHGNCDGIYLFGNDSVKDFYPRLGFASAPEYQCSRKAPTSNLNIKIDQLNMEEMPDLQLLKMKSADFNPYSLFSAENNEWLVLFYSTLFYKDKFWPYLNTRRLLLQI
ncbi:GNAT family N-acetyltransferase [Paenibacillus sp. JJ1683]